ncbi:CD1871A family CXXC motif-containing protein [Evtepia gabavorous]
MNRQGITILLLIMGTLALLYGVHRDEHLMVAQKSNLICLECIGIG